jgi:hypothetical protein
MQIILFVLGLMASHAFAMWIGHMFSERDFTATLDSFGRQLDRHIAAGCNLMNSASGPDSGHANNVEPHQK